MYWQSSLKSPTYVIAVERIIYVKVINCLALILHLANMNFAGAVILFIHHQNITRILLTISTLRSPVRMSTRMRMVLPRETWCMMFPMPLELYTPRMYVLYLLLDPEWFHSTLGRLGRRWSRVASLKSHELVIKRLVTRHWKMLWLCISPKLMFRPPTDYHVWVSNV